MSPGGNLVACAVPFAFGGYLVAYAFMTTVTLPDEEIEMRTVFGREGLRLDEIQGRRSYWTYGDQGASRGWKLAPTRDGLPTLKLPMNFEFDPMFHEWLNNLPDLDDIGRSQLPGTKP